MLSALIDFETWLLDRSILFLPTFMAGSPFEMNASSRLIALQTHIDACIARWPWLLNLNTPIQDPSVTDGPYMLIPDFCFDATHPNAFGYDAMYNWVTTRIDGAVEQSSNYYGFVEA